MTFHLYGNAAMLINFEQKIDPHIHMQVMALQQAIEQTNIRGLQYCIPAYCSLTIVYEPDLIAYPQLKQQIEALASASFFIKNKYNNAITHQIPVCYDAPYALDMETVMKATQLSKQAIIQLHTATKFRVYMLGFLPGFAYLGKLPDALFCKRKQTPRLQVPALSVGIAAHQTGIYPSQAPGGWQIIGQTTTNVFDKNKANPFLFKAGDYVQFYAV